VHKVSARGRSGGIAPECSLSIAYGFSHANVNDLARRGLLALHYISTTLRYDAIDQNRVRTIDFPGADRS
jgi:hypothetical protein